jgi:Flp pilus assembly protein TadD
MMSAARSQRRPASPARPTRFATIASLTASLMLGACSATSDLLPSIAMAPSDPAAKSDVTNASSQSELQKATAYWGDQYAKNPADLQTALNYAKDLKAQGDKEKAFSVLQQASTIHNDDRELASEYGRLALEFNQVNTADQLLAAADDPSKPDWRVISARGTVMAKQGRYSDAIPFFDRAASLAPNNATVLNNLAMAHAMMGDPKKAEEILRQAIAGSGVTPKVRENLALVLGLQGRYAESNAVAAGVMDAAAASSNEAYLKQLVNAQAPAAGPAVTTFTTKVTAVPAAAAAANRGSASATPPVWKTSVSGPAPSGQ